MAAPGSTLHESSAEALAAAYRLLAEIARRPRGAGVQPVEPDDEPAERPEGAEPVAVTDQGVM